MARFFLLCTAAVLFLFLLCEGSQVSSDPISRENITTSMREAVRQCHLYNTTDTKTSTSTTRNEPILNRGLLVQSVLVLVDRYASYSFKISEVHSIILLEFFYRADETSEAICRAIRNIFENLNQDFRIRFVEKLPNFLRLNLYPIPLFHVFADGDRSLIEKYKIYINNLYNLVAKQLNPETDEIIINCALQVIASSIITTDFADEMMDLLKAILSSNSDNIVLNLIKSEVSTYILVEFLKKPKTKTFLDMEYFLSVFLNDHIISELSKLNDFAYYFVYAKIIAVLGAYDEEYLITCLEGLSAESVRIFTSITDSQEKYIAAVQKMKRFPEFQSKDEFALKIQNTETVEEMYDILKTVKLYQVEFKQHDPDAYKIFYKTSGEMLIYFLDKLKESPAYFQKRCFLEFKFVVLLYDISGYEQSGGETCIFTIVSMFNITAANNIMSESEKADMSSTFESVFKIIHTAFQSKSFKPDPDRLFAAFEFLKSLDSLGGRCFELTNVFIKTNPTIEGVTLIWNAMLSAEIFDPNIFVMILLVHTQQTPPDLNFLKQFATFIIEEKAVALSQRLFIQKYFLTE